MTNYSDIIFDFRTTSIRGIDLPMKRYNNIDLNFWSFVVKDIEEHIRYLREDFVVRNDDVFICTYPRSGTNWTHELVQMLLYGNANFAPLFAVLENLEPKRLEKIASPRVFCSHLPYQFLPSKIIENAKVICVFRNPKDVAVSLHNFMRNISLLDYDASWNEFLNLFLDGDIPCGKWSEHIKDWERIIEKHKSSSIMTLKYEDMKSSLLRVIEKLANFLGVQENAQLFADIAEKCEFKSLYREKTTNLPQIVVQGSRNIPNAIYRKGDVGDWKNWFTVAQNELFDNWLKENMKNSTLQFNFTL